MPRRATLPSSKPRRPHSSSAYQKARSYARERVQGKVPGQQGRAAIIQHADVIVLVLSTEMASVTLTQTVWEYLRMQGVEAQRVYAILNRAVGLEGQTKAEAEQMLGLQIRFAMPYMGGNFSLANTAIGARASW